MIIFGIIAGIAAADLWIKWLVCKVMQVGEKRQTKWNRLFFWHIKNKGVAYNHLEGRRKGILLITGGAMIYFLRQMRKQWKTHGMHTPVLAMAFLVGGALGNFLERIKKGYVTDYIYIQVKGLPIFNLADVFILLGTAILSLSSVFHKENL